MKIATLFASVLMLAGIFSFGASPVGTAEAKKSCIAGPQNLGKFKNIGCRHAKRVYFKVRRHMAYEPLPDCRGDRPVEAAGWRMVARPYGPGGIDLATKFTRKRKSFVASGGGVC